MSTKTFINLPTKNLEKATAFYEAIGFTKNPQFSDENASGFAFDENIHVMILTEGFFKWFLTHKQIADSTKTCEVMNSLQMPDRGAVDIFLSKALSAWANEFKPAYDHGFMYGRDFEDLDGHIWEIFRMDVSQMPKK